MATTEPTASVKARLRQAGFARAGIARAGRLDRDQQALNAWLERDAHASMAWMAREPAKRADPRELLDGCRSVVVAAMSYWPGAERADVGSRAKIALYARGRDYHKVLGKRLRDVAAWMEASLGSAQRTFVDTGPVLERAWAERAGLGWIGKNANLISREGGSWWLLGEILTTAELDPDDGPHADFCGSCNACLTACPTGAIVEPGVVDSARCISYWTIEHRGAIPEHARGWVDDWIFGCDVCQEVCPWNRRFAAPPEGDPFGWREDLRGLDPVEILGLGEQAFRARYSGTALMRAKWEGMRRNACLVLGNRGDPAAVPALRRAVEDADPVVASHAGWALERILGPDWRAGSAGLYSEGGDRGDSPKGGNDGSAEEGR